MIIKYKSIGVTIAVILAIWIAYTAFISIPREELANKLEIQAREELAEAFDKIDRENKYNDCKDSAYRVYSKNWDSACETMGREPDCLLPTYKSNPVEERYEKAEADCLTIYKTK